ncbi:hypothetical protein [Aquimarina agarivorans]|uniref:hypothetical protein n=1 Tax=Aquimarina agarivorans TaxID=980584 RepID=UPI000248F272|nr:hypothetical protein [Aquimarina agarivorans]
MKKILSLLIIVTAISCTLSNKKDLDSSKNNLATETEARVIKIDTVIDEVISKKNEKGSITTTKNDRIQNYKTYRWFLSNGSIYGGKCSIRNYHKKLSLG